MSLDERIAQRKLEAESKDIRGKARTIAQYLGTGGTSTPGQDRHTEYNFSGSGLQILYKDVFEMCSDGGGGYSRLEIVATGNMVYKGGWNPESYVPGGWEKTLDTLYKKAKKVQKKQFTKTQRERKEAQAKADAEKRQKWGL